MKKKIAMIIGLLICSSVIASDSDEQIKIVGNLYKEFAWEAIFAPSKLKFTGFAEQTPNVLETYLDKRLAKLLYEDRLCGERTHEECNLGFCPLWASQDPGASDLEITSENSSNIVKVRFRYPGNREYININYQMIKTEKGWRISDIIYEKGNSLLNILKSK